MVSLAWAQGKCIDQSTLWRRGIVLWIFRIVGVYNRDQTNCYYEEAGRFNLCVSTIFGIVVWAIGIAMTGGFLPWA